MVISRRKFERYQCILLTFLHILECRRSKSFHIFQTWQTIAYLCLSICLSESFLMISRTYLCLSICLSESFLMISRTYLCLSICLSESFLMISRTYLCLSICLSESFLMISRTRLYCLSSWEKHKMHEPHYDKTNKMACLTSEDSD